MKKMRTGILNFITTFWEMKYTYLVSYICPNKITQGFCEVTTRFKLDNSNDMMNTYRYLKEDLIKKQGDDIELIITDMKLVKTKYKRIIMEMIEYLFRTVSVCAMIRPITPQNVEGGIITGLVVGGLVLLLMKFKYKY